MPSSKKPFIEDIAEGLSRTLVQQGLAAYRRFGIRCGRVHPDIQHYLAGEDPGAQDRLLAYEYGAACAFLASKWCTKYDGNTAIDTFYWTFDDVILAAFEVAGLNSCAFEEEQFALFNLFLAVLHCSP